MGPEQLLTITDYWAILMRRKLQFAGSFSLVLALGIAVAFLLPPVYRSEATIMIERQAIPQNLVATTVTGYVQEQIEQIRQRITSYENLLAIAREHNLYTGQLDSNPSGVAQLISENIEVEMQEVEATDPDRTGARRATIAFTVAFLNDNPRITQLVANDLANRYLAEHRASREESAREVSQFLEMEGNNLRSEIASLESAMATFKEEELHRLPKAGGAGRRRRDFSERFRQSSGDVLPGGHARAA